MIAKAGKPMARLVPMRPMRKRRKLGWLKGKLEVPEDFDSQLPVEVIADFEGRVDAAPR